jgi:hypothetical protein
MPFLTQGKTNWKFLLIVIVLVTIVAGFSWWAWINRFEEGPLVKQPPKEISEQKALELANQVLQLKCQTSFSEIKKENWTRGGPGFDSLVNICPALENYKENKIWVADKRLRGDYWASVLVGFDGKLVCASSSIIEAAPGGPFPLDYVCKEVAIITDRTEYEQGEMVKIIIKNNLDRSIWYWDRPVFGIEGFSQNEKWKKIEKYDACACDPHCYYEAPGLLELKPGGEISDYWGQKIDCEENFVSEGKYRASFAYYDPLDRTDLTKNVFTIDSNEFTIKETAETANWKTYRNEEYNYEVKYPNDWVLDEKIKETVTLNSPENEKIRKDIEAGKVYGEGYMRDIIISYYSSVSEEPENKANKFGAVTIDELIQRDILITPLGQITFAGEKAYEVSWGGFIATYSILVEKNNHLYKITFGNRDKSELTETEKQILSTFKFLD